MPDVGVDGDDGWSPERFRKIGSTLTDEPLISFSSDAWQELLNSIKALAPVPTLSELEATPGFRTSPVKESKYEKLMDAPFRLYDSEDDKKKVWWVLSDINDCNKWLYPLWVELWLIKNANLDRDTLHKEYDIYTWSDDAPISKSKSLEGLYHYWKRLYDSNATVNLTDEPLVSFGSKLTVDDIHVGDLVRAHGSTNSIDYAIVTHIGKLNKDQFKLRGVTGVANAIWSGAWEKTIEGAKSTTQNDVRKWLYYTVEYITDILERAPVLTDEPLVSFSAISHHELEPENSPELTDEPLTSFASNKVKWILLTLLALVAIHYLYKQKRTM